MRFTSELWCDIILAASQRVSDVMVPYVQSAFPEIVETYHEVDGLGIYNAFVNRIRRRSPEEEAKIVKKYLDYRMGDDAKNGYTIQKPKMLEAGDLAAPRRSR